MKYRRGENVADKLGILKRRGEEQKNSEDRRETRRIDETEKGRDG